MMVSAQQWRSVRAAVEETGDRLIGMLATGQPERRATADWTLAETAAHVLSVIRLYPPLLAEGRVPFPYPDLYDTFTNATVDDISAFNEQMLTRQPERDLDTLAELLRAELTQVLKLSEPLDPALPLPWAGDSRLTVAGMLAHVLNELQQHGHDVAGATGSPWHILPEQAGLFFDLFLVGVIRCGQGRLLESDQPGPRRPVAVRFTSDHTTPVTLVVHPDKQVTATDPGPDDDVRLRFDPPTLNMMMFGRVGKARAVLTGKVVTGGPRPWRLPTFLRVLRVPSRLPRRS